MTYLAERTTLLGHALWKVRLNLRTTYKTVRSRTQALRLLQLAGGREGSSRHAPPIYHPGHSSSVRRVCNRLRVLGGDQLVIQEIENLIGQFPEYEADILWGAALSDYRLERTDTASLRRLEDVFARFPVERFREKLYQSNVEHGELNRALKLVEDGTPNRWRSRLRVKRVSAWISLLESGLPRPGLGAPESTGGALRPRVVAYLLHNSISYDSGGYATRTHGLLKALAQTGWNVIGLTRLGYPRDRHPALKERRRTKLVEGIRYDAIPGFFSEYKSLDIVTYLRLNARWVERWIRKERPQVIHAASNFINGFAAVSVGQKLGIPTIYEVRGLWELTRISRQPNFEGSERYRAMVRAETEVCLMADQVITITNSLKDLLVSRGVDAEKITVAPNGVDTDHFSPSSLSTDGKIREELGIASVTTVFGYVGSIVDYEGLALLLAAFARALSERGARLDACLLFVGDGDERHRLLKVAEELNLLNRVYFVGRVPHEDVLAYYSAIDVVVIPRLPTPVTQTVSPIKPFEALALGIPLIASDVRPIAEALTHGNEAHLVEAGNISSLSAAILELHGDQAYRKKLSTTGRFWVRNNREWSAIAKRVSKVYSSVLRDSPSLLGERNGTT